MAPDASQRRRAYLGLGGNLGNPPTQFAAALGRVEQAGTTIVRRSSLYRSPPLGPPQPDYVNAVVEIETDLEAAALMERILAVEHALGRTRNRRWGPRSIDIDILLYGAAILAAPGLTIPHPGLHTRAFVLVPLAELEPKVQHPVLGETVEHLLAKLSADEVAGVRKLDRSWP